MEHEEKRKRLREEEEEVEGMRFSSEAKRVRGDILDILEEEDDAEERLSESGAEEELVSSVMKSLQDEIEADEPLMTGMIDGSVQPDLGYLLEASDYELGLPPATSDDELGLPPASPDDELGQPPVALDDAASENEDIFGGEIPCEMPGFGGCWDFEEGMAGFGLAEEFGLSSAGEEDRYGEEEEEPVVFESLFDYSDAGFWRPESMPAV